MRLAVREAKTLESLDHPNLVKLLAAFKSKTGRVYMVFEFVGPSLHDQLDLQPTGLAPAATKLLAWQLLSGVAYLHDKKVLHRDIKPANVLLEPATGVAKLSDFGFARPTKCGPQVLVRDHYGAGADVWSLGCTIAEMATGRALFPGTSSADQLWRIVTCLGPLAPLQAARALASPRLSVFATSPPPLRKTLRQRLPELEPRLFEVVEACLRLDPRHRPTVRELLAMPYFWDVRRAAEGTPVAALIDTRETGVRSAAAGMEALAAVALPSLPSSTPPTSPATPAPALPASTQPWVPGPAPQGAPNARLAPATAPASTLSAATLGQAPAPASDQAARTADTRPGLAPAVPASSNDQDQSAHMEAIQMVPAPAVGIALSTPVPPSAALAPAAASAPGRPPPLGLTPQPAASEPKVPEAVSVPAVSCSPVVMPPLNFWGGLYSDNGSTAANGRRPAPGPAASSSVARDPAALQESGYALYDSRSSTPCTALFTASPYTSAAHLAPDAPRRPPGDVRASTLSSSKVGEFDCYPLTRRSSATSSWYGPRQLPFRHLDSSSQSSGGWPVAATPRGAPPLASSGSGRTLPHVRPQAAAAAAAAEQTGSGSVRLAGLPKAGPVIATVLQLGAFRSGADAVPLRLPAPRLRRAASVAEPAPPETDSPPALAPVRLAARGLSGGHIQRIGTPTFAELSDAADDSGVGLTSGDTSAAGLNSASLLSPPLLFPVSQDASPAPTRAGAGGRSFRRRLTVPAMLHASVPSVLEEDGEGEGASAGAGDLSGDGTAAAATSGAAAAAAAAAGMSSLVRRSVSVPELHQARQRAPPSAGVSTGGSPALAVRGSRRGASRRRAPVSKSAAAGGPEAPSAAAGPVTAAREALVRSLRSPPRATRPEEGPSAGAGWSRRPAGAAAAVDWGGIPRQAVAPKLYAVGAEARDAADEALATDLASGDGGWPDGGDEEAAQGSPACLGGSIGRLGRALKHALRRRGSRKL
ncbi:hypothetical protein HYH03_005354 [Edaphochlamys debaryana]|uniref:Protein kinase domain-containing protein n=1 Tax=Edaphochlamys debaryana TaxID=47281 RepID=A0A835Y5I6_9CHLO|nr:hypothetical protein HYH03_005354 [Edaphochlamys debaryana]|eukprot:KAG2496530.1 hypothetical protein HYH03_005354 [Edaphochlamys debaryana]